MQRGRDFGAARRTALDCRAPSLRLRLRGVKKLRSSGLLLALGVLFPVLGCGAANDARKAEIASVMARADEPLIRARPRLVAGKYARMAASAYDFYRGSVPLALHDFRDNRLGFGASAFTLAAPLVPALGDPHAENFGTLLGADGTLALEPNDLDAADFAPYLWDVRRLVTGMALAARVSNPDDADAQETTTNASLAIARAAAEGYADAVRKLAAGAPGERVVDGLGYPVLDDLFERSEKDYLAARAELDRLTVLDGQTRHLRRGVLDPKEPTDVLLDVPEKARAALPEALAHYRETLLAPPPPEFFTLLDAARELGSGVASWPRVRVILLVRGPSDAPTDDVVLELKELADSGISRLFSARRVVRGQRRAGPPRLARFVGAAGRGAVMGDDVVGGAGLSGKTRKRRPEDDPHEPDEGQTRHARGALRPRASPRRDRGPRARGDAEGRGIAPPAIAEVLARDPSGFAAEQAEVGDRYAAEVLVDWELFRVALDELGPRLGVPNDPRGAPSPDLSALYADDAAP